MMKAVAALALFESVSAFQAPLAAKSVRAAPQMFSEGDIGVLPPLGVYDPLGLIETRDMARYEVMEIKHGCAAAAAPAALPAWRVASATASALAA